MTKKIPIWASKLVSEKIMYEKLKNEISVRIVALLLSVIL